MTFEEFKKHSEVVPTSYNEGAYAALCNEIDISTNPYEPYSLPWIEWVDGWVDTPSILCNALGFRIIFH